MKTLVEVALGRERRICRHPVKAVGVEMRRAKVSGECSAERGRA
jgi:hypothetical protein